MFKSLLLDKTFACLAAGAIGDAMGAPVEGWHYQAIRKKYGVIDRLIPDLGIHQLKRGKGSYTYTDDTHLRNYIVQAIIEKGGRITAYDLADAWLKHFDPDHNNLLDEQIFRKLCRGVPPREAGEGIYVCVTATLGIAPIGIINACDPKTAAMDAFEVACMSQWKYGRETAMSIAAAVAEAFKPEATLDSIINASKAYVGPKVRDHINQALNLAKKYKDPIEAIPEFYDKLLVLTYEEGIDKGFGKRSKVWEKLGTDKFSFGTDPLEMVPISLALFYIAEGDPIKSMIGGANFGRDCDGIAGFAGSIAGAMSGSNKIDKNTVEKINKANDIDLMKQAEEVQEPIINVMKEKEASIKFLRSLL